jgi:hypothetical protein
MKKLILLITLFFIFLVGYSQNFIKEFQINTVGESNELVIPSGFRIGIESVVKNPQADGTVNVIFYVNTYKDDTYSKRIDNDEISWTMTYNMSKADAFTQTDLTIYNNTLKPDLITVYGAGNIQEL